MVDQVFVLERLKSRNFSIFFELLQRENKFEQTTVIFSVYFGKTSLNESMPKGMNSRQTVHRGRQQTSADRRMSLAELYMDMCVGSFLLRAVVYSSYVSIFE